MLLLRSVVSFWLQFFGIWLFSPSLETVRNYFSPLASWSFTTMCHGLSHFSSEIFNQKKHIIFDTLSSFSSLIFPPHHFICFLFLVLLLLKHWTLWTESFFKKNNNFLLFLGAAKVAAISYVTPWLPSDPCETQDCHKKDQEGHLAPVRPVVC